MRIAENRWSKITGDQGAYIELADERGKGRSIHLIHYKDLGPLFGNSNDLRTTKRTGGKAKAGTLSNRSKAFEEELLNGTPERYPG